MAWQGEASGQSLKDRCKKEIRKRTAGWAKEREIKKSVCLHEGEK